MVGMENSCLTFVTPTLVAGDRSEVDVAAHEISHVSCPIASLPVHQLIPVLVRQRYRMCFLVALLAQRGLFVVRTVICELNSGLDYILRASCELFGAMLEAKLTIAHAGAARRSRSSIVSNFVHQGVSS